MDMLLCVLKIQKGHLKFTMHDGLALSFLLPEVVDFSEVPIVQVHWP